MGLFDSTTAGSTPASLSAMLQGLLPGGATGWLNPSDPNSGMLSTPQQDTQRQQMAQLLAQQGSSYAPVQSAWQGAARMAQSLAGALMERRVTQDQNNGRADYLAGLANLLGGDPGSMNIPATPGFTSPALQSADAKQDALQDAADGSAPSNAKALGNILAGGAAAAPGAGAGGPSAALGYTDGSTTTGAAGGAAAGANPYGSQPSASAVPSLYPAGKAPMPSFAAGQGAAPGILSSPDVANAFSATEQRYGLPQGYLSRTAQIESKGNPNAYNQGSGAAGLFQFIPSTARAYGLTDPTNPLAAMNAAGQLAASNAGVLRNALGRDPTPGELYLAHQQGAGGASQLLANPNARAGDIVGDKAVRANGGDPNMTAGQFAGLWTGKFGQGGLAGGGIGGSPAPLHMLAAGGSPYGTLDQNAFSGQQGAPQGPILAQPGMGGLIPSGGGFGPLGMGQGSAVAATLPPVPAGGGMAYSASGQPQPTDANGNALDANGRPTALAFNGQTVSTAGQQAIDAATSAGGHALTGNTNPTIKAAPYGSVPLSVNGRLMTRDQADANNGTNYTDYDDAAAAQGLIPSADRAPPFVAGATPGPPLSSSTVTGGNVPGAPEPSAYARNASDDQTRAGNGLSPQPRNVPLTGGGASGAAPAQPGMDRGALMSLLGNPYTPAGVQQFALLALQKQMEPHALTSVAQGTSLYDPISRQVVYTNPKDSADDATSDMKNYAFYTKQAQAAGQTPMTFDVWSTAKARAAAAMTNINLPNDPGPAVKFDAETVRKNQDEKVPALNEADENFALMQAAMDRNGGKLPTGGALAQAGLNVARVAQYLTDNWGLPQVTNPDQLANLEAFNKGGIRASGELARAIGGNRVLKSEIEMSSKAVPGLDNSNFGNSYLLDTQRQSIDIQRQYYQAQEDYWRANHYSLDGFQKSWAADIKANPRVLSNYSVATPIQQADGSSFVKLPTTATGGYSWFQKGADGRLVDSPSGQPMPITNQDAMKTLEGRSGSSAPGGALSPAAPQSMPQGQGSSSSMLNDARSAIAAGAPRGAVEQRLRSMNIDPSGL